jgi:Ftsk gamma domain
MSDFDAMHRQEGPASEEGTGRSLGRDAAGLGLFALATLLGVSVFMSLSSPAEEPHGTTALFTSLCGLFGPWSLFPLAIALAFLGGRLWVAGIAGRLGRHLAGAAAVALALSVLASAASAGAGGTFGDLIGSNASRALTPFAGVPLALAVLAGVIWAFWLRTPGTPGAPRNVQKAAPRRVAPTDSGGLTPDEAAALLPAQVRPGKEGGPAGARESQDGDDAAFKEIAQVTGRSIPIAPDLKPIYPPDVRLQGGIPEGTRPLETRDQAQPLRARQSGRPAEPERAVDERTRAPAEPFAGPSAPAALPRTPEPHAAPLQRPADAHLAASDDRLDAAGERLIGSAPALPERGAPPVRAVQPLVAAAAVEPPSWESERAEEETDDELAPEELEESEDVEVDLEDAVVAGAPEAQIENAAEPAPDADELPPRPGWEQPGLFDEEPVDAYGTPTKLVDALRKSNEAAAVRLKDVPLEEEEEELDEDELDESEEAELDLEEDEAEDDGAEDDGEELEESDDEEEVEANAEDLDDEDDEAELADEGDSEAEDEVEEEAPAAAESATEVEEPSEPEVILEPRRRPRATSKPTPAKPGAAARTVNRPAAQATEELDPESDLLFRAGALFIQRGRVAVSMLQRDFNLDFKQATSLLDQLQEAGLIGPYLGGQRRDILLTIEEWRERRIRTA